MICKKCKGKGEFNYQITLDPECTVLMPCPECTIQGIHEFHCIHCGDTKCESCSYNNKINRIKNGK